MLVLLSARVCVGEFYLGGGAKALFFVKVKKVFPAQSCVKGETFYYVTFRSE